MLFPALNPLSNFLSVEALLTEVREGDCQVWEVLGLWHLLPLMLEHTSWPFVEAIYLHSQYV